MISEHYFPAEEESRCDKDAGNNGKGEPEILVAGETNEDYGENRSTCMTDIVKGAKNAHGRADIVLSTEISYQGSSGGTDDGLSQTKNRG